MIKLTAKTFLQLFGMSFIFLSVGCGALRHEVDLNVEQIEPIKVTDPKNTAQFAELMDIPLLPEKLPPRKSDEFVVPRPKPLASNNAPKSESNAVSLAAAKKAKLTLVELAYDGNGSPVLRMNVDFHYAWPLVQNAIEKAKISLVDLNRSLAIFYINVPAPENQQQIESPGLWERLFGKGVDEAPQLALQVKVNRSRSGVYLSIQEDAETLAPDDLSQTLLSLIKKHLR